MFNFDIFFLEKFRLEVLPQHDEIMSLRIRLIVCRCITVDSISKGSSVIVLCHVKEIHASSLFHPPTHLLLP